MTHLHQRVGCFQCSALHFLHHIMADLKGNGCFSSLLWLRTVTDAGQISISISISVTVAGVVVEQAIVENDTLGNFRQGCTDLKPVGAALVGRATSRTLAPWPQSRSRLWLRALRGEYTGVLNGPVPEQLAENVWVGGLCNTTGRESNDYEANDVDM